MRASFPDAAALAAILMASCNSEPKTFLSTSAALTDSSSSSFVFSSASVASAPVHRVRNIFQAKIAALDLRGQSDGIHESFQIVK